MLTLEHIKKSFGQTHILHDVSLNIKEKEFVCLIGPSGCGKSTLLKIIAGLEQPDSGLVHLWPQNALPNTSESARVSMVFQNGALLPWRTAEENVELGFGNAKQDKKEAGKQNGRPTPKKFLATVGLTAFADKYPHQLSGGQRQRVGIARALAAAPSILLLDEPFSALDPKTTHDLHDDILRVWKDERLTVLMVSHQIEEAVSLADRVVLMKAGAIEEIFPINLPYPRREQGVAFHDLVQKIRAKFFV